MQHAGKTVLIINGGSSSIKYAVYSALSVPVCLLHGKISRIGLSGAALTATRYKGGTQTYPAEAPGLAQAGDFLISWLKKQEEFAGIAAIGHRIVHGMGHTEAELVTPDLIQELQKISSYDPDHLPGEIALIKTFGDSCPGIPQVACFDTAFHATMPVVARMLPLPRRLYNAGIKKYGFHGLSYTYIMQQLQHINHAAAHSGRIVIAHLGNGASMAAIKDGRSIDTTMGFTPAGGLVMGTRPGDIDPGAAWFLMQKENTTPQQFSNIINHQSGLLGVSEISSDMHDLATAALTDTRAKEAVDLFCYQAKKWLGAFTAALGGIDVLVFTGGIGENAPAIRSNICNGLQYMGIEIDENANNSNKTIISAAAKNVTVYVIPTDEELVIAKATIKLQHLYESTGTAEH